MPNQEEVNQVTLTRSRHVDDKGINKEDYTTKTDSDEDKKTNFTKQFSSY